MKPRDLSHLKRILIIKPSALGDVVQSVGVVRALKEQAAQAEIGWLVNAEIAPLLEPLSFIHRVHRFERGKLRGLKALIKKRAILREMLRGLREAKYDAVIDLQGLARSAAFARATKARTRIGFANARELAPLFYTIKVKLPDGPIHAVERYRSAAGALGMDINAKLDGNLESSQSERASVREKLAAQGIAIDQRFVVLCPGARWASKQWPEDRFAKLAHALFDAGWAVALSGSPGERELCDQVVERADCPVANMAGETSLRELAALMAEAKLCVSNDSGPMHIAAAQSTPLVALFGPTDPALTGPFGQLEHVLRAPAEGLEHRAYRHIPDNRVMRGLSVERVFEAALGRLGDQATPVEP